MTISEFLFPEIQHVTKHIEPKSGDDETLQGGQRRVEVLNPMASHPKFRSRTVRAPQHRLFVAWSILLGFAATWESKCAYSTYDLKRSTPTCTTSKAAASAGMCYSLPRLCLDAQAVAKLSPRWLSGLSGMGGPLLSWVPLLLLGADKAMLATVLSWYVAFIMPVRHAKLWLPLGFDPSGHVFVYGAQLVPLIFTLTAVGSARPLVRNAWLPQLAGWLGVWLVTLCFLSGTTSAFFHTPAETSAGWLLVALLHTMLHGHGPLATRHLIGGACLWCVGTGAFLATGRLSSMRLAEIGYDLVLFVLLRHLVNSGGAESRDKQSNEAKST